MSDFEKWEARYGRADAAPGTPEPFIVEHLGRAGPGERALDVAGGLGRHALALAEHGYQTTLVDVAPTGLDKAAARLQDLGHTLETVARDLAHQPLPEGSFARIVVTWFLLSEARFQEVGARLSPSGSLLYVQPTTLNLERHDRPGRRFLFTPGALAAAAEAAGLKVLSYDEAWRPSGHHLAHLRACRR